MSTRPDKSIDVVYQYGTSYTRGSSTFRDEDNATELNVENKNIWYERQNKSV